MSIAALIFSALGSIFMKKITKHIDKLYTSSVIGLSILIFSLASVFMDELLLAVRMAKENHVFMHGNDMNHTMMSEVPVTTSLQCLVENGLTRNPNMTLDELMQDGGELQLCQEEVPPYIPDNGNIWAMAFVVAFLGITQQYCLIGRLGRPVQGDTQERLTFLWHFFSHPLVSFSPNKA